MSREVDKQAGQSLQGPCQSLAPKSNAAMHCVKAFLVGGLICVIGQGVSDIGKMPLSTPQGKRFPAFTAIVMVIIGATLTGIGVYDRIGKFAGAGSIIPITGFANSVVAPAMEFRSEGFVMGTGARLFQLAGPVLVNGYSVSVVIGIILFIMKLCGGLRMTRTRILANPPAIIGSGSVAGPMEGRGPMRKWFDSVVSDDTMGEKSYEKAELMLFSMAADQAMAAAHLKPDAIDFMLGGRLA